jgi:hypothetical protein
VRPLAVALAAAAAALALSAPTAGQETSCAPNTANRLRTVRAADQLITVETRSYRSTSVSLRLFEM